MNPREYKIDTIELSEISDEIELLDITLLDGGRTSFYCKNGNKRFWIRAVTNGFEDKPYQDGYWPGGLYLNKKLIDVNSDDEKRIIQIMRTMKISQKWYSNFFEGENISEGESIENLIKFVINFIKSSRYYELALKTNRINKNRV